MSSGKQEVGGKMLSSRLLSRERSAGVANASFRVYYSLGAGTVPFVWESKPGTPKSSVVPAAAADAGGGGRLPPISPPPSYQHPPSQFKKAGKRSRRSSSSSCSWMRWFDARIRPPPPSADRDGWFRPGRRAGCGGDHDRRPRGAILCCF